MALQETEDPMAKKKGRPGPAPKPHMVKFTMDDGPHQTLREEAAKRGMSMSAYSAALVLEGLGYDKAPAPKSDGVHRAAASCKRKPSSHRSDGP